MVTAGREIKYRGVDNSLWHLHGRKMGEEGVYLTSLAGFYHPVRLPMRQTPAYMRGAKPGPSKTDPSVIGMKIFTSAESPEEWEDVESAWWSAWSDDEDGLLIATDRRGNVREQPVRLERYPDEPFDYEPDTEMDWTVPLIAYSPGWRGATLTSTWLNSDGDGAGKLLYANPGDIEIWPQLAGWGRTGEVVTAPDGIDGESVELVEFDDGEHWLVDTDQMQIQLETVTETQAAARMAAMRFQYPIPPRTTVPVEVDVSVAGGTTETEVKAYMTPLFMRPWG